MRGMVRISFPGERQSDDEGGGHGGRGEERKEEEQKMIINKCVHSTALGSTAEAVQRDL